MNKYPFQVILVQNSSANIFQAAGIVDPYRVHSSLHQVDRIRGEKYTKEIDNSDREAKMRRLESKR
jgi:hypothetical protein